MVDSPVQRPANAANDRARAGAPGPIARTARMLQSFVSPRQVGYLILYVTNRCNFRCPFCFYYAEIEKGTKPNEMTLDELRRVSERIGPLLQLSLTGGEPFLRAELADIAATLIENTQVRFLTIVSNGSLTDRMVRFFETVLPRFPDTYFRLSISIDGIGERHDQIRGTPGSYKKIQRSYAQLSSLRERFGNLVLDANSVYTAESEHELLATLQHIDREFAFDNLSITYARGDVKDPALKQVSKERYIEINAFLEQRLRTRENRFLYPLWRGVRDVSRDHLMRTVFEDEFVTPCVAGRKLVVLNETGDVLPCEILGKSMGNIRDYDYDMSSVLATQENRELVQWIRDSKCKCSFECALAANVVWTPSVYPKLALSALKNLGKD
jgi:radical SAM protein with 4Fe4S-binding SPASM domain